MVRRASPGAGGGGVGAPRLRTALDLGLSAVDITPRGRPPVAGYFYPRRATGVHDPLRARILLLSAGRKILAVIVCDAIHIPTPVADELRRSVAHTLEIPEAQVAVAATHAHTSPEPTPAYRKVLVERVVEGAREAAERRRPVTLHYGNFDEPTLPYNRRYWMKDGTVATNPGKGNPDALRPSGPVDPEAHVLEFRDAAGRPAAVWVSYALHPDTIGGTLLSADFPHFLGEALRKELGSGLLPVFTLGAAGNVNHWNLQDPDPQRSFEEARRIGETLARGVLRARPRLRRAEVSSVGAEIEDLALAPCPVRDEEVRWARRVARETPEGVDFTLDVVRARKVLELDEVYGRKPLRCPVQSMALGREVAFTMIPAEPFAELGLTLKDHSPFSATFVVALANGHLSYLPNRASYRRGGYEPTAALAAAGEGERVVETAVAQLRRLYGTRRGRNKDVPERPGA